VIIYPEEENSQVVKARRTPKYLMGLVNGAWIISYSWIIHSIVRNRLQREEE